MAKTQGPTFQPNNNKKSKKFGFRAPEFDSFNLKIFSRRYKT